MTSVPELHVHATADQLAADVAARTAAALSQAQQARGRAALCLTAGGIMEQVWAALSTSPAARSLDWTRVDVFFGDERFVAADSPDRNDLAARRALFDDAPFADAAWYPMPASDGEFGDDLDAAAAGYAATLASARRGGSDDVPDFDVLLLGIGPDGHCASLFPGHESARDDGPDPVIAVRNSPKPPPNRISLSFAGLAAAEEIWFVVAGAGKADAVARSWSDAPRSEVPSAGPRGRVRTLWLVDREAAGGLPQAGQDAPDA